MTAAITDVSAPTAAVRAATYAARPVELDDVMQRAALQERVDTKYLVDADELTAWVGRVYADLDVLQIGRRREFEYESTYFDTEDRALFRAHRQGRRRRYKVRTRSYLDTGTCHLEVKLDRVCGATLKERTGHPLGERHRLTALAQRCVTATLRTHAHVPPGDLVPALTNSYRRSTLLLRHSPVRITCDTGLRWTNADTAIVARDRYVMVEVKAGTLRNPATAAFARVGVRPTSVSKYCAGIALLEPWRHANPWRSVLDRYLAEPRPFADGSPHPSSASADGYPTTTTIWR
jgi:hypothetical protein